MYRVQVRLESGQSVGHTMMRMGTSTAPGTTIQVGHQSYEIVGVETYDPTDFGLPEDDDDAASEIVLVVRPLPAP